MKPAAMRILVEWAGIKVPADVEVDTQDGPGLDPPYFIVEPDLAEAKATEEWPAYWGTGPEDAVRIAELHRWEILDAAISQAERAYDAQTEAALEAYWAGRAEDLADRQRGPLD